MSLNMAPMFQNLMTHKVYTVFCEAMAKKSFDKFSLQCVVITGVGSGKYVWRYYMAKKSTLRYLWKFVCCMEEFRATACPVWPHNPLPTLQGTFVKDWADSDNALSQMQQIHWKSNTTYLRCRKKNVENPVYCWFWMITSKRVCFVIPGHYGYPEGFLQEPTFCWGHG